MFVHETVKAFLSSENQLECICLTDVYCQSLKNDLHLLCKQNALDVHIRCNFKKIDDLNFNDTNVRMIRNIHLVIYL